MKFEQSMETNIIRFTTISKFIYRFGEISEKIHTRQLEYRQGDMEIYL